MISRNSPILYASFPSLHFQESPLQFGFNDREREEEHIQGSNRSNIFVFLTYLYYAGKSLKLIEDLISNNGALAY